MNLRKDYLTMFIKSIYDDQNIFKWCISCIFIYLRKVMFIGIKKDMWILSYFLRKTCHFAKKYYWLLHGLRKAYYNFFAGGGGELWLK